MNRNQLHFAANLGDAPQLIGLASVKTLPLLYPRPIAGCRGATGDIQTFTTVGGNKLKCITDRDHAPNLIGLTCAQTIPLLNAGAIGRRIGAAGHIQTFVAVGGNDLITILCPW